MEATTFLCQSLKICRSHDQKVDVPSRCNEIQDTYYVPTLYQYQYEIEDGYRRDGSPVRIGYDDAKFPEYSWRGYGSYSQLQNEVNLQKASN